MVRIQDGIVVEEKLPLTGRLATGESVSGYNLLPVDVLLSEGWLPVVDSGDEIIDPEAGQVVYTVEAGRVLRHLLIKEDIS